MYRFCRLFLFVLALLAIFSNQTAKAAEDVLDANTMKVALHTATAQEDGWIEYVLTLVDKGTLPAELVHSTFRWARKKPNKKFYYFKEGLILRAKDAGITI